MFCSYITTQRGYLIYKIETQHKRRKENQLDATECFIALKICSTYFGQIYAQHQELESILVLFPHMVCNALVAGGRLLGAEQQAMRPG
jgi:hypothetical protein